MGPNIVAIKCAKNITSSILPFCRIGSRFEVGRRECQTASLASIVVTKEVLKVPVSEKDFMTTLVVRLADFVPYWACGLTVGRDPSNISHVRYR